jgi:glyoxylase-like metal-dependent hydrolase (beta-lactamase superfamily II)
MQRATLIRLAGLTLAIGGVWTALTQQPPAQPLTVEKIADDLHVIVGSGGNVGVLTTSEGVILIDDKFERNVPEILAKVKSITSQPIKYVINTHQHGDHTGGNQSLMTSAEIFAHKNAAANMVAGSQPGVPRIAFADELVVRLGGKEVRARHFGAGHTNGDAVIYFPAHKVVHMGDLFVRGAPFIDYSGGGSSEAWLKTIDGALTLDADTWIPGHGAISKRSDLTQFQGNLRTLRSKVSELIRKGTTKEQFPTALKLDDLGWPAPSGLFAKSLPALYDEVSRAR